MNPAWRNVKYPTDIFEARNPNGVYLPRQGEESEAQRLFADTYHDVWTLPRRPGTLTVFKGRHAMHRVTEVRGKRQRISALLSYDSLPDQFAEDATNAFIYGPRVAAILAARRAEPEA